MPGSLSLLDKLRVQSLKCTVPGPPPPHPHLLCPSILLPSSWAECPVTWLYTGLCLTWGGNAPYLEIADTGAVSRDSLCHCPVPDEQRTQHQAPVCCDASQERDGVWHQMGTCHPPVTGTPTLGLGFPFLVPSLSIHPPTVLCSEELNWSLTGGKLLPTESSPLNESLFLRESL